MQMFNDSSIRDCAEPRPEFHDKREWTEARTVDSQQSRLRDVLDLSH